MKSQKVKMKCKKVNNLTRNYEEKVKNFKGNYDEKVRGYEEKVMIIKKKS